MKTFKDGKGRPWTLEINVDAIKRVKGMLNVNLLEALDGDLIERLSNDPLLLCDVIYALVKTEADACSVSDEEFGRTMGGDVLEHATAALLEELISFFPQRRRQVLTKALAKIREVETKGMELAERKLEAIDTESLLKAASESFGKQQA